MSFLVTFLALALTFLTTEKSENLVRRRITKLYAPLIRPGQVLEFFLGIVLWIHNSLSNSKEQNQIFGKEDALDQQ